MTGKAAGSPAYWRYAGDRERSQAPAGPGQRRDFGHAKLGQDQHARGDNANEMGDRLPVVNILGMN